MLEFLTRLFDTSHFPARKLNGYEACRWIREQPWGKNILMN